MAKRTWTLEKDRYSGVLILALPCISCVTLDRLLKLSETQLPYF